jgi:hypothetical protein
MPLRKTTQAWRADGQWAASRMCSYVQQGCSRSRRDAVCSVIAAFVLLVGASVADDAVPTGSCVFAPGLVRRSLSGLALQSVSRVAGRCPLPFRPAGGAEAEAPLG